jgi:GlpG protein
VRKLSEPLDESNAGALAALLDVNDIENKVRRAGPDFAVWVVQEDDLPAARLLLASFDPKAAEGLTEKAEKVRREREIKKRPIAVARSVKVRRDSPLGLGVGFLIGLSVLVAVVSKASWYPPFGLTAIEPAKGSFPTAIDWSEPWRWVTPMFIHFGLFHLVFNMMWLRRLGAQIEENHGTYRFLGLVLLSETLANVAQYWLRGPYFGGMSGVNYALFGFGWMYTRYGPADGYAVTSTDAWWLMSWLVLCATGLMGPVANAAHAGGLICGILCGLPVYVRYRQTFRVKTTFEKGSWEDLNVHGAQRFRRLYVEPYMPGWFLFLAFAVLGFDYF